MSADFEKPTHEELREDAAEREAHYFLGEKLEPFSLGRQMAIQRIGTTSSEVENALLLVFICTLSPEGIDRLSRDAIGMGELRLKMEAWGGAKGVSIHMTDREGVRRYNETTEQLIAVANRIYDEIDAGSFKPKTAGESDPKASGRGSRSTTPRKSRPSSHK
jgi:hypothetical protein